MLSGRTDYYLMYSFYLEKKVVDELFLLYCLSTNAALMPIGVKYVKK